MPMPPAITARELADLLAGELTGDGTRVVRAAGTLEDAGPEAVAWVGQADLMPRVAESNAGVVVIPKDCAPPPGRTSIRVADPDLAMCAVLTALKPPVEAVPPGIDRDARVAETASVIGASIGPHAYVGAHSRIGQNCVLWPNAVVREYTQIGDRVVIHANATLGADGFGYHQRGGKHYKIPQIGRVVIEDDVEIGANTCIDRARSGETRIGRGTKIDNLVQIGHNVRVGEDCILVSQCGVSGSTMLGHHVVLAGQVGLIDHLSIGNNVVIAAKSGVAESIPDGKVFRGIPAVELNLYARQAVGVRRLPKMIEQLRDLLKRVERLESTEDRTKRS